ncbi:uncharacterized protein LOC116434930 isoform X2 [Nomia melanderi]|uniref:uncharacterized protein LOC116434930 isoform X2 n=1 Tax=Nomia melanderi TaxID=2448451 RepID=UPI0013040696|nr:nuclear pore complex protein DDB_G0274915-like isoform X2 [Nomia melanderi]
MVICKYYRQGNCRFGQYCQFQHINTFGNNTKTESYNQDEYTAVAVAKEVLSAERGGQWLLSCFAPLKQKPCIPGMEDVSPEEVRWEMYQAQKNGMVEQAKLRFQQLCQDMKAKREALKNPTHETIEMLKELQGTGQKGIPGNTSTSNVFGSKTFGNQSNPFSGSFTSTSSSSIFGRANTSNPIFGGTPGFGNNLGFGSGTSTSSVFGGTTNTTTTFNTDHSYTNSGSIFGGSASQNVFGQPSIFGTSNPVNNVFARPQTSQSTTSVFSGATSAPSLFSGSTSQANAPILNRYMGGANKTSTANPFGNSSTLQTTNSIFGATASTGAFSSGLFSQSKPAFGGAPVFGSAANFGNANTPMFGEQPGFGGSNNIFGGTNNTTPTFSSAAQPTNAFGATVSTPAVNLFGSNVPTTSVISTSSATPFGTATTATSSPFAPATSQFEAANSTAGPFSRPTFGMSTSTSEMFGTTVTSSGTPFGTTTNTGLTFGTPSTTTSPFTPSTIGGDLKSSPFATTNTTVTTTTTNPFAPRTQQTTSPFGNFAQNQTANTVTVSSSEPFGKPAFGVTMTATIIDDSIYTAEDQLTDDEKSMYLAEKFTFGKIPLKPPTKAMR